MLLKPTEMHIYPHRMDNGRHRTSAPKPTSTVQLVLQVTPPLRPRTCAHHAQFLHFIEGEAKTPQTERKSLLTFNAVFPLFTIPNVGSSHPHPPHRARMCVCVWCWGQNPEPPTCQGSALPLSQPPPPAAQLNLIFLIYKRRRVP